MPWAHIALVKCRMQSDAVSRAEWLCYSARYGDAGERLSPWVGLGCMFMGVVILVS